MGPIDEGRSQLITALESWDFSGCFPQGYTGTKGVLIVPQWPYDLVDNMLKETNGQMTQPIISVVVHHAPMRPRTIGSRYQDPSVPAGKTRYAMRAEFSFLVSCWADQLLGGSETTEKLAGQVMGAVLYSRVSLPALRHLQIHDLTPGYEDHPQLWYHDLLVEGDAIVSYDQ